MEPGFHRTNDRAAQMPRIFSSAVIFYPLGTPLQTPKPSSKKSKKSKKKDLFPAKKNATGGAPWLE